MAIQVVILEYGQHHSQPSAFSCSMFVCLTTDLERLKIWAKSPKIFRWQTNMWTAWLFEQQFFYDQCHNVEYRLCNKQRHAHAKFSEDGPGGERVNLHCNLINFVFLFLFLRALKPPKGPSQIINMYQFPKPLRRKIKCCPQGKW